MSALRELRALGQSVWLDDIRREYLVDGKLNALIEQDGVSGLTSNPAIFERAIRETALYDVDIEQQARAGADAKQIYLRLIVADVQRAADLFQSTYHDTHAIDGYVSLEVSPHLAHDTQATVDEAKRLWATVAKPNLMIKVPGTEAGLFAIRALVSEGINVNVTLLFCPGRYAQVIDAYWSGLEDRLAAGQPLERIASVASFFVSRIDGAVDPLLHDLPASMSVPMRGRAAIALAARAYEMYRASLEDPRWRLLERAQAQPQRLLWASTGTKDTAYSDVKYVESLIGWGTVTTLPMETLTAYRNHGDPQPRISEAVQQSDVIRRRLDALGIDLKMVVNDLEREGVRKFVEPFDRLLGRIDAARGRILAARPPKRRDAC